MRQVYSRDQLIELNKKGCITEGIHGLPAKVVKIQGYTLEDRVEYETMIILEGSNYYTARISRWGSYYSGYSYRVISPAEPYNWED